MLPPEPAVDLRSDTVTKPTAAMRRAMAEAVVGNAAWGEDPTVLALEAESARVVGKEAALFVPSGTMGNQIAIRVHTARSVAPEVILESLAHIYLNEAAAIATVSHAQVRTIRGERGVMAPAEVEAAFQPASPLKPQTALVCLENTHNYHSGAVLPQANVRAIAEVCRRRGVPLHMDGARIFNAAVATGLDPAVLCAEVDTVQFCFSKGLGAPVGSVLCGPAEFIASARKVRQYLGGAMRQAGVVAAPALLGLAEWRATLPADHRRAKRLAEGLAKAGLAIDPRAVETNIVIVDVAERGGAPAFVAALRERGVGAQALNAREMRFVTHRDVDDAGIERALEAVAAVAGR